MSIFNSPTGSLAGKRLIRSQEDGIGVSGVWVGVIIYCAIAFPIFYVFAFREGGLIGGMIGGFFAIFGVIYAALAVHLTLNRRKFGRVNLYLPPDSLRLGGEVAGRIMLPEKAAAVSHVRIELRCLRVSYTRDSKGRNVRSEKREWYRELPFPVRRAGRLGSVEFRMAIPDEPVIERGVGYVWEIQVRADLPGLDLSRSFTIDVLQPKGGLAAAALLKAKEPVMPSTMTVADEPPSSLPVVALIIANLVPLAGVLFGGWTVGEVVILYWIENLVIGVMNVARIACAAPDAMVRHPEPGKRPKPGELALARTFPILFFIVHFGGFCIGHGIFLAHLFPVIGPDGRELEIDALVLDMLGDPAIVAAVLGLVVSHLISFVRNYLGRGEYRHAEFGKLMTRPYGRIFILHIFIIAGAFIVTVFNSPQFAIVLFVVIKTVVDLYMHRRERQVLS